MSIQIHTDGGARGNPGPAAIGVVIDWGGGLAKRVEIKKSIGETTNNVAEYRGVIEALLFLRDHKEEARIKSGGEAIHFFLDSNLVVNQLNGLFKVKDTKLRQLLIMVRGLEGQLNISIRYQFVPRELNYRADLLVNRALDSR